MADSEKRAARSLLAKHLAQGGTAQGFINMMRAVVAEDRGETAPAGTNARRAGTHPGSTRNCRRDVDVSMCGTEPAGQPEGMEGEGGGGGGENGRARVDEGCVEDDDVFENVSFDDRSLSEGIPSVPSIDDVIRSFETVQREIFMNDILRENPVPLHQGGRWKSWQLNWRGALAVCEGETGYINAIDAVLRTGDTIRAVGLIGKVAHGTGNMCENVFGGGGGDDLLRIARKIMGSEYFPHLMRVMGIGITPGRLATSDALSLGVADAAVPEGAVPEGADRRYYNTLVLLQDADAYGVEMKARILAFFGFFMPTALLNGDLVIYNTVLPLAMASDGDNHTLHYGRDTINTALAGNERQLLYSTKSLGSFRQREMKRDPGDLGHALADSGERFKFTERCLKILRRILSPRTQALQHHIDFFFGNSTVMDESFVGRIVFRTPVHERREARESSSILLTDWIMTELRECKIALACASICHISDGLGIKMRRGVRYLLEEGSYLREEWAQQGWRPCWIDVNSVAAKASRNHAGDYGDEGGGAAMDAGVRTLQRLSYAINNAGSLTRRFTLEVGVHSDQ